MPNSADLVTDLPADFNVFGQGVDTSMQYLLGGTTGQVLSKTSATNMAFTWINNDQGDITGVTAGNGITVTSPTGPVPTVAIDTTVTADLTTAQTLTNKKLSDSTTTIVDVSDATKAIKFDVAGTTGITGTIATAFTTAKTVTIPDTTGTVALTNGVINNTLTTTTGDIIYASSANTPARLGIGSSTQVLTVTGGVPVWATPAGGSTAVGCLVYSAVNQACTSAAYKNLLFDTEVYDTDGFHSTASNTNRITIPSGKAGKYLFTFLVNFDGNATGRREYYLYKNGVSTSIMDGSVTIVGAQDTGFTFVGMDDATVGDYYNVSVWQNSGSTINVRLGREKNFFGAVYLGA